MIRINDWEVIGFEHAIRGMRNPMNSWSKSDSKFYYRNDNIVADVYDIYRVDEVGKNDRELMMKLRNAGTDHRKFMRMITVYADITAPLYWVAEHDTYKVGTVRNSCSFMHKGVSKPFDIKDFSVSDERIYEVLSPIPKKHYPLIYPYETEDFKIYETTNGRKFKVYRNGKVFSLDFEVTDMFGNTEGRTKHFQGREIKPSENKGGYYELNLGGRSGEKWLLHRLVAHVWLDNKNNLRTVNHINGNKGDNSVENLEWTSLEDNIKKGFEQGLYDSNRLHCSYIKWKNGHVNIEPNIKEKIRIAHKNGTTYTELSNEYDLTKKQLNSILSQEVCAYNDLFLLCYQWEKQLELLNALREEYLDTKDDNIFQLIRQALPSGYNIKYTWMANYEVLANIYKARKNHRLKEWRDFCKWIETLPYAELVTGEDNGDTV